MILTIGTHSDTPTQRNNEVKDCLLLFLMTAFIYLPFLGLPVWDGNEPLRVIIAKEMLKTGDWIMPMLHGNPYITKPPMMNWLIAGSGSLFGVVNEWTSRVPSVCMVFATALLVYFMTKKWLSREARLFASVAVICMIGLIKKGRTAEIDSLFIFFITIILLIWLNGYVRQWKPLMLWSISLSLVGVGFLTKGPQVIAYFYLTVFAYLLFRKKLSFFFSKEHLSGLLFFALIVGIYISFVLQHVTIDRYMQMWFSQIIVRAESKTGFSFFQHLIAYPLEALLAFMPWTLLTVPLFFSKNLRRETKKLLGNELFVFSLVMVIVNFPLYWVLPNARFRYFLPAGPFVAFGFAVLFEMYLNKARENTTIKRFFNGLLTFCAGAALISSIGAIAAVFFLQARVSPSFTSPLLILICSLIFLGLYIMYAKPTILLRQIPLWLAVTTGLVFITYAYIDIQFDAAKHNNPRQIAHRVDSVLHLGAGKIYEMGYRRFLGITCYLNRDIIQLDEFSDLQSLGSRGEGVYFLFDTKYPETRDYRKKDFQEIRWDRVYSEFFEESRGDIVVGYLKRS